MIAVEGLFAVTLVLALKGVFALKGVVVLARVLVAKGVLVAAGVLGLDGVVLPWGRPSAIFCVYFLCLFCFLLLLKRCLSSWKWCLSS